MQKLLVAVLGVAGGVLMFAAETPKEEAVSNLATWIPDDIVPQWLASQQADEWGFYIGLILVIVAIISFLLNRMDEWQAQSFTNDVKQEASSLDILIEKCKKQDTSWMSFEKPIEKFLPHRISNLRSLIGNVNKIDLRNLYSSIRKVPMIGGQSDKEIENEVTYMLERLEANGYVITDDSDGNANSPFNHIKNKTIKFTEKWDEL